MISEASGQFLLRFSRQAIIEYLKNKRKIDIPKNYPKELNEKKGIFVTLHKEIRNGIYELRGCMGIPYPIMPIIEAVIEASISAANDPRFIKLKEDELKKIKIEISILTEPELIKVKKPEDYLKNIRSKIDGLIIKKGIMSGLLLPQVWNEVKDKEEFLNILCYKAGLLRDSWKDPSVEIYKFQVQIFKEK
ncbi:MAG: AmmeMemoRadiSam system protein A [Candidatus Aenigmarchaeota archaeon]|nr:AmmeMemoRadiSam system protein A [Candidatus Aenigmarchaeota archaeon]